MNRINWTVVAIVGILAVLALMIGGSLLGYRSYGGYGGWGMMGPWMMGPWMMGGMFFMWLIPVGFIVLTVLGIAWLVKAIGGGTAAGPAATCPNCRQPVRPEWKHCANCGATLTK